MFQDTIPQHQRAAYAEEFRRWGQPIIFREVVEAVPFVTSRPYVARIMADVPATFRPHILAEYSRIAETEGEQVANTWIRESVAGLFQGHSISHAASDDDIREMAERCALRVEELLFSGAVSTPEAIRAWLLNICDRYEITPPKAVTLAGITRRMTQPKWWRRKLRNEAGRRREEVARKAGFVHLKAGKYISEETMLRQSQHARRSREFLAAYEYINELGEVVALEEVFESGQSNPKNRYIEMMIRARGMDADALEMGWDARMVTLTCPSRMHARHESGAANKNFDGTTPREAHDHLQGEWEKVRAATTRRGIEFMGVRVEEPHHDGTPHWHMLVYAHKGDMRLLLGLLSEYYLRRHSPDEKGAAAHRVQVERIDRTKGTGAGYLAKYVSKNLEGENVGADYEAGGEDARTTAPRAVAWARVHRVRQFQFFGTEKVTTWRELRRLREAPANPLFHSHWQAANAGDWQAFVRASAVSQLGLWVGQAESQVYPGEIVRTIKGVRIGEERLETKLHTWERRLKPSPSDPRTRVNNCTGGNSAHIELGAKKGPPPGMGAAN